MSLTDAGAKRWPVITALGVVQIFTWGSSFYLMAVLAAPIVADTGWPLPWVVGALSLALACAGFVSPWVGRAISQYGGRIVLALGCGLLAIGLMILALAPNLGLFYLGWGVIGLGMAGCLYDPAFSTLGQLYGQSARAAISMLTLWGGFASTVCWPLSVYLQQTYGWRGAAFAYALIHLLISIPLILWLIPKVVAPITTTAAKSPSAAQLAAPERLSFALLSGIMILCGLISTMIAVHLLSLLVGQGLSLPEAVAIGTMLGPAQVAARLVEMAGRGRYHPIWSMFIATSCMAIGLVLLALDLKLPGLAIIAYGAGNGLFSIARGALPLTLFGVERYPVLMGRLARPSLLAQAVAPIAGGAAIASLGGEATLAMLVALAVANVVLTLLLMARGSGPASSIASGPP